MIMIAGQDIYWGLLGLFSVHSKKQVVYLRH